MDIFEQGYPKDQEKSCGCEDPEMTDKMARQFAALAEVAEEEATADDNQG